jgi:anti-sigma B factor antagonist
VQSHFRLEVSDEERATVLTVSGELDLASSPALDEQLERAGRTDTELVILDLRKLDFMDSTGLRVVIKAHQRAEESGARFGVINGGPQIRRLLTLSGVTDWLTLVDTPDELLGPS